MPTAREYFQSVLTGGLPAALDLGTRAGAAQGDNKPEQTPPEPTKKDTEPFKQAAESRMLFASISSEQITMGLLGVAALFAVIYVVARAVR